MYLFVWASIIFGCTIASLSYSRIRAAAVRPANGEAKDLMRAERYVTDANKLISFVRMESVRLAVSKRN